MKRKAWCISNSGDSSDDHDCIVFTETAGKARVLGMFEFGCDFIDINVRREKKYDEFAERGYIPVDMLLKDGWWFECSGCFSKVNKENNVLIRGKNVYCPDCARKTINNCG